MDLLVDCSYCRTALHLPQGATLFRCVICQAITQVAVALTPAPNSYHHISRMPSGHVQVHGQKRAVVIAVSYKGTESQLNGCINDAKCMKFMLINRFRFPEAAVLMLNEEETDTFKTPTKLNIRRAMFWLIHGCQQGDSLVFYYSGHGSQKKDLNGDEIDGFDETICPMDFQTEGVILDDEINDKIVKPIPYGVKLHAIVDACHSGTVLDLPYLCRMNKNGQYEWEDHRAKNGTWKGTSGGEVVTFSGCDDDQTSVDTAMLSKVTTTGAMTYAFIEAIESGHGATYGSILTAMRATINNCLSKLAEDTNANASGGVGVGTRDQPCSPMDVLAMFLSVRRERIEQKIEIQEPQLTANEPFDVFLKPFSL